MPYPPTKEKNERNYIYVFIRIYIYMCVCMYVRVCVYVSVNQIAIFDFQVPSSFDRLPPRKCIHGIMVLFNVSTHRWLHMHSATKELISGLRDLTWFSPCFFLLLLITMMLLLLYYTYCHVIRNSNSNMKEDISDIQGKWWDKSY